MTPYARAWRNTGLMVLLVFATPPALVLLALAIGDRAYFVLFLAWIPLAFWLNRRVRCPGCGTSPYVSVGWGLAWSKPWPNALCARCGRDLRA